MSTAGTLPEFNKFRQICWPIYNHEFKKFFPMVVMFFFFLFNYTIMRDTKDTLVLTAAGAEAIPFLKFWGTLPMSVLFVLVYAKMSNALKPTTLFYSMVIPFMVFFVAFGFIIYPNLEMISPTIAADSLQQFIDHSMPTAMHDALSKLVMLFRVWPFAIFYILSELWGSMGISLLFWQFANQITNTNEAKRFYGSFAQLGNLALVASGLTIIYTCQLRQQSIPGVNEFQLSLQLLMGAIAIGCAMIMAAYWYMNNRVMTDKRYYDPDSGNMGVKKKKKPKLSMAESFKFLCRSKYLGCIAILVIAYGVSINMIEVVWKAHLKMQFPNENDLNTFMGYFSMSTGITTLFLVIVGSNVLRRLGWKMGALTTPLVLVVTGGLFFTFVLFKESMAGVFAFSPVFLAVIVGMIQNVLSKGMKYSVFDPTKEMAYIPLDQESKVKGKAAIDVVGARLGKSGGSILIQAIVLSGPLLSNLPMIFAIVCVVVCAWIASVFKLDKLYQAKLEEKEQETIDADAGERVVIKPGVQPA